MGKPLAGSGGGSAKGRGVHQHLECVYDRIVIIRRRQGCHVAPGSRPWRDCLWHAGERDRLHNIIHLTQLRSVNGKNPSFSHRRH